eukprot:scaffold421105_cov29-Attheya_sp.AAC.1
MTVLGGHYLLLNGGAVLAVSLVLNKQRCGGWGGAHWGCAGGGVFWQYDTRGRRRGGSRQRECSRGAQGDGFFKPLKGITEG